jgi:hypothetical protein
MFSRVTVALYCIAVVLTSLLFFFRVRAIFFRNQWVVAFFGGLWLAVFGAYLAFTIYTFDSAHAEGAMCVESGITPYLAASTIIALINDTLIFLAITWHISRSTFYDHRGLRNCFGFLGFGDYPAFSKALLRDGQAYYLLVSFFLGSSFRA